MPRHFGILVPSTNTTCEIEFCRLAPELQVHTGRLGKGGKGPFSPSLDADVAYQAKLLGDARVEVIALAQTSASLFSDDYDAVTVKRMTEASGVPCLTSAQAIGRALRALKASRVAMATPYSEEVIGRARRYYETKYAITVVASESLGATDSTPSARWTQAWPRLRSAGSIGRASTRWWCRAATSRPWTGLPPGSASSASR